MFLIGNRNYSPPYESPLEDSFALQLDKYLGRETKVTSQVPVDTICGSYRLDFVAETSDARAIGFECDGAEFHDASRDEWRDAMILGTGMVAAIYRFPGSALTYHMEDCLYFLSLWEPRFFDDRGKINLARLASSTAREAGNSRSFSSVWATYFQDDSRPYHLCVERHVIEAPPGGRSFLKSVFEYAKSQKLSDLDELMARYRSKIFEQITDD